MAKEDSRRGEGLDFNKLDILRSEFAGYNEAASSGFPTISERTFRLIKNGIFSDNGVISIDGSYVADEENYYPYQNCEKISQETLKWMRCEENEDFLLGSVSEWFKERYNRQILRENKAAIGFGITMRAFHLELDVEGGIMLDRLARLPEDNIYGAMDAGSHESIFDRTIKSSGIPDSQEALRNIIHLVSGEITSTDEVREGAELAYALIESNWDFMHDEKNYEG